MEEQDLEQQRTDAIEAELEERADAEAQENGNSVTTEPDWDEAYVALLEAEADAWVDEAETPVPAEAPWGTERGLAEETADSLASISPDLTPFLDGTYTAPTADVGSRSDGAGVFYAGATNRVFGKAESAKTMLVLHIAGQQLAAGLPVVYCDYENGPAGIVPRLIALGVKPELIADAKLFRYLDLRDEVLTAQRRAQIASSYREGTMVVFDSVAGIIASNGLSSNAQDDAEKLLNRFSTVLLRAGHAVVFIDHETDRAEGGGRSTGSHRKRDLISGASYRIEKIVGFSPWAGSDTPRGRSRLFVDKDRAGTVRTASVRMKDATHFGDFTGEPKPDGRLYATLWAPDAIEAGVLGATAANGTTKPTAVMQKVSELLEQYGGGLNKAAIEEAVRGRAQTIRAAIEFLKADGFIRAEGGGGGKPIMCVSLLPYRTGVDSET